MLKSSWKKKHECSSVLKTMYIILGRVDMAHVQAMKPPTANEAHNKTFYNRAFSSAAIHKWTVCLDETTTQNVKK